MPGQPIAISLDGSPYTIDATGRHMLEEAAKLQGRADLLRERGSLTDATLRAYFGDKRYEQIAESNAIEGSTLSAGETELAVEKGITITGHDPAYSADAINLSRALAHMVELAKDPSPSDCRQVKELHSLILGGGPTTGLFRSGPVRISGSCGHPQVAARRLAVSGTGRVDAGTTGCGQVDSPPTRRRGCSVGAERGCPESGRSGGGVASRGLMPGLRITPELEPLECPRPALG